MEEWLARLQRGHAEAAWDLLVDRYRRLIIASIRHYARDHDDVMDAFAHVCGALRAHDFRRLRHYAAQPIHRARFSTWLVTVVRHLTIDWLRQRDGRRRPPAVAERLSPLHRRIFEHVFVHRRSHRETYELLQSHAGTALSFEAFLRELAATHREVSGSRSNGFFAIHHPMPDVVAPPDVPDAAEETREAIGAAMAALPPADRLIVQLYVMDELPATDVARIVGLANAKAVYNRVYRVLGALRAHLEQAGVGRAD